jgi:hypothetical protein
MAMNPYLYTTPLRVSQFLQEAIWDANSTPTLTTIEQWILMSETHIERETSNAWKITEAPLHYYDIPAFNYDGAGLPIDLRNRNIVQLSSTVDTFEVWVGSTYENWLTGKTESRANDYWLNYEKGILYIRHNRNAKKDGVRLKYRYNSGAETTLTGTHNNSVTTINVTDTTGFPYRGIIRVGSEEISYTGKTATTFTGCSRGYLGSTAGSYSASEPAVWIPEDIIRAATLFVAIKRVTNADSQVRMQDAGNGNQETHGPRLDRWQKELDQILSDNREWGAGTSGF